jgi:Glycosyl transferases group 1
MQMRKYRFSSKSSSPRVLCISQRDIRPVISRCLRFEFEDLIGDMDAVDVIAPGDTPAPANAASAVQWGVRTLRRLAAKALRRLALKLEGMVPVTGLRRFPPGLASSYELLFVVIETVFDLSDIGSCAIWRSRARVSICYIDDLYVPDVAALGSFLKILNRFDHIIVTHSDSVKPLAEATGRSCHYLAPSTDVLKFCPYPRDSRRVIDFYAMGRRDPKTHDVLLRLADEGGWYYMYDTVGNCPVTSYAEHRSRLAEMIKRSRFFLVNPAQYTDDELTGGQQELGFRFFEGAAAGAVLIGSVPHNASFDEAFGWQDSVVSLRFDSDDVADVIVELDADPNRLEVISKTNVVNSLRRHDHVYRWAEILAIAGLEETTAMQRRRRELEELASSIERTIPGSRE